MFLLDAFHSSLPIQIQSSFSPYQKVFDGIPNFMILKTFSCSCFPPLKARFIVPFGLRSPVPLYTLFYICKISAKQNQTSMFKTKQNKTGAKTTNSTFFSYYQLSIKPKNASNLKHGKQMYLEKRANLLVHTCL